ncbi:MAG TPA: hypothetical protein VGD50_06210 [Candidatus Baltobacteraceae bacterium]
MGEVAARAALRDDALVLRVLKPWYPAMGLGKLRVLRIQEIVSFEGAPQIEILAGYDRYERLSG